MIKDLLDVKEDELDKHYIFCNEGTFSRRELAHEIDSNSEVGKKWVEQMIGLSIDRFERKKEKTKDFESVINS